MNEDVARAAHDKRLFSERADHLGHLPGHILLDLARNESASRDWRKAAVEILLDKGYPQVNHPALEMLVHEIKAERTARTEVEAIVESAIETEMSAGPFRAGVTTATLMRDQDDSPSGGAIHRFFSRRPDPTDVTLNG